MARKKSRGNGTGTVAPRRNGQGKVIGYQGAFHGPDGKRRWVSAKTKTECWAKLNAAMTDADRGILPSPATLTVERYLSAWLTDSIEGKLARASHDAYKRDVHYHIIPALGRRKLKDLSTPDVRRFYRKKRDEGLSNRSLEYIHTTLRKALQDAKNDGVIIRNPTDGVKPHKTSQGTAKESEALDPCRSKRCSQRRLRIVGRLSTSSLYTRDSGEEKPWDSSGRTSTSKRPRCL
jgi:integrase